MLSFNSKINHNACGLVYSIADQKIFNYCLYDYEGYWLRGPDPRPLKYNNYLSFIGSAQTFGRFTYNPFVSQISNMINFPCVNLGWAGAGPENFIDTEILLNLINNGRLAILQIMSARGIYNSLMQNAQGNRMVLYAGQKMDSSTAWENIINDPDISSSIFWQLVDETRSNWISYYYHLFKLIRVPIILLFFGINEPILNENKTIKPKNINNFMGTHPQLVTRDMINDLSLLCNAYAEVITNKGLPQKLSKPVIMNADGKYFPSATAFISNKNNYYPSPEMHDDAAKLLIPIIQKFI